MTSKKEKKQMLEYIVSRLNGSDQKIEPVTNAFGDFKANYIRVGDNGLVFLVDKIYANNSLEKFHQLAKADNKNVAYVFYKDGETFFKNASESQGFKQKYDLSLKNYTSEQMKRIISFRPEEIFMKEKNEWLQYYQPQSERLNECIVSFKFKPVKFDYSHLPAEELQRLKELGRLEDPYSKRMFIWAEDGDLKKERKENHGFLKIGEDKYNSYLVKRDIDIN